jgi:hypothetical protein
LEYNVDKIGSWICLGFSDINVPVEGGGVFGWDNKLQFATYYNGGNFRVQGKDISVLKIRGSILIKIRKR